MLNARYLEAEGYGLAADEISDERLGAFIERLPDFERKLAGYRQDGNADLLGGARTGDRGGDHALTATTHGVVLTDRGKIPGRGAAAFAGLGYRSVAPRRDTDAAFVRALTLAPFLQLPLWKILWGREAGGES